MYLKTLSLKNFRNFASQDFEFHPQFNFIFGKNAQGKTNIMEAIYYISELKSFRTANKSDLILNGMQQSGLKAIFEKDGLTWGFDIHLCADSRQVLLNDKKPPSARSYHEVIPLILFEPRHIYLFRDSPSVRRQYLNRGLYLQDVGVLTLIHDYEKIVNQKNRLLKERPDPHLLAVWNEKLADAGARLLLGRINWLNNIHGHIAGEYRMLSRTKENITLSYQSRHHIFGMDDAGGLSHSFLKERLLSKIHQLQHEEIRRRESLVGPHRDDFRIFLGERDLGTFGSQGENRSAVIALKLAQLKMFAQKYKKTPLFLLDDVTSELDADRCSYLFSYLRDETTQVFLTTTDNNFSHADFQGHSRRFLVEHGRVSRLE